MKLTYSDAGVDIREGNRAVELMKESVRSTYTSGVIGDIGLFSGGFSLKEFTSMEEPVLLASTDGVGTKVLIGQEMNIHNTLGIDLVAMCVNDLICQGAKPLFFLDYIATGKLKGEKIGKIVDGIAEGCRQGNLALIGGETAEMPGLYQEDEYDLAGFSVGIADKKNLITGEDIEPGDIILGLASTGLHSNGYSLARKLFLEELGYSLDLFIPELGESIGEALLRPTKIYVKEIQSLMEKFTIKGISNITGGGFYENIPRILKKGLGAKIKENSWDKGALFNFIIKTDKIEKKELYRSFNMGIGIILVISPKDEIEVLKELESLHWKGYSIGKVILGEGVSFT
ncbi:MAG: phosphoribosylformylglycinamidine cyclo-ligase [Tissierellia bacterium]|nr:phosphoribosylformylglycinamidine cyclo-ligase [Tissierellia bacterium]